MISVIIPVYNAEAYLGECLDSLLAQDLNSWEAIIVDDCSADSSLQIAKKYATAYPERFRVIRLASNSGPSAARNAGIEAACGRFIMFLDADDMLFPGALKTLHDAITIRPHTDLAIGDFSESLPPPDSTPSPDVILSPDDLLLGFMYQKRLLHHSPWAKLFRRELFGDNVRFDPALRCYEDMALYPDIASRVRQAVMVNSPVYYYRPNPASIIRHWTPVRLSSLDVTDHIVERFSHKSPLLHDAARSLRLSANFNCLINATLYGHHDVADRCWHLIRTERLHLLCLRGMRLKNRLAILLTFFGRKTFLSIASRLPAYRTPS